MSTPALTVEIPVLKGGRVKGVCTPYGGQPSATCPKEIKSALAYNKPDIVSKSGSRVTPRVSNESLCMGLCPFAVNLAWTFIGPFE